MDQGLLQRGELLSIVVRVGVRVRVPLERREDSLQCGQILRIRVWVRVRVTLTVTLKVSWGVLERGQLLDVHGSVETMAI